MLSWSSVLSWMLFAMDVCLIGFLSFRAYRDGKGGFLPSFRGVIVLICG